MPENGRKDDLFIPDFVKEAEEQIAKEVKLPTQEEVTIKFGKGLAEPFQSKAAGIELEFSDNLTELEYQTGGKRK